MKSGIKTSAYKQSARDARAGVAHMGGAKHFRVCADCGYKDSSLVPPEKCPRCHNQAKNPLNEAALEARPMNRAERRKQTAERRAQERKVNKQIARETAKSGGKYEAS